MKIRKLNPYKIIGSHPVTNEPISLKWYRGASRYNNGATIFGNKYLFRYLISRNKCNNLNISPTPM